MSELTKADMLKRMQDLDEEAYAAFDISGRFSITIVGGSALILFDYLSRSTDDIDILNINGELIDLIESYDMNTRVRAHMSNFPYNYEDRVKLIWSGSIIDFYAASLEDIVISKLCAARSDDLEDIAFLADKVDWQVLEKLARDEDELKSNIMNDRHYSEFLHYYEDYERRFRPCVS